MKNNTSFQRPYLPIVSIEDMLAFKKDIPETWTRSRFVNELLCVIQETHITEVKTIAEIMNINPLAVTHLMKTETGMNFQQFRRHWVEHELRRLRQENPRMSLDRLAPSLGFASHTSLNHFLKRNIENK